MSFKKSMPEYLFKIVVHDEVNNEIKLSIKPEKRKVLLK